MWCGYPFAGLGFALFVAIVSMSLNSSNAGWQQDLRELKEVCDQGLLPEKECQEKREKIWSSRVDQPKLSWFCNFDGSNVNPDESQFRSSDGTLFSEAASAQAAVKEILDAAGLAPNFVIQASNVPNAAAVLRAQSRYIEYNPNFIS